MYIEKDELKDHIYVEVRPQATQRFRWGISAELTTTADCPWSGEAGEASSSTGPQANPEVTSKLYRNGKLLSSEYKEGFLTYCFCFWFPIYVFDNFIYRRWGDKTSN